MCVCVCVISHLVERQSDGCSRVVGPLQHDPLIVHEVHELLVGLDLRQGDGHHVTTCIVGEGLDERGLTGTL